MQLLMRRPEINRFIAISPQPNVYDFTFLAPCPFSGLIVYGKNDELVEALQREIAQLREELLETQKQLAESSTNTSTT